MKLKLYQLDLTKGENNSHPQINGRNSYLCLIDGSFYAGKFSKVWFGWHFDGWMDVGIQYDKPGYNSSTWQGIWKIRRSGKKIRKTAKLRAENQGAERHCCPAGHHDMCGDCDGKLHADDVA